jgi:diphthine methyl ester synthase
MVLYFVGLGLADEKDVTLKGFEAIKNSRYAYLEAYTSILMISKEKLEEYYQREFILADREFVESNSEDMIKQAKEDDVWFWVVGDPFGATTHADLFIRWKEMGVEVKTIPNASIINAIGITGLQLYRFGEIVSIPFFTENWRPYSFAEKIEHNLDRKLHTLCLLDIKVKEPTEESLCMKVKEYMEPKFMSTNTAVEQLLEASKENEYESYNESTKWFGVARIGSDDQKIVSGELKDFLDIDMGAPLHSFIICGELHPIEEEMYEFYKHKE